MMKQKTNKNCTKVFLKIRNKKNMTKLEKTNTPQI